MERRPLSLHEKVLLVVVGIAGAIALFYMFVYQPQVTEIDSLTTQVAEKRKEVSQFINFDQTIADTNMEIDDYSQKIYEETLNWYSELSQDDIINDLDEKIKLSGLNDSEITFVNTQTAQIASMFDDPESPPTLADALALAYIGMTQAEATPNPASPTTAPAQNNTSAAPASTPTPTPANGKENQLETDGIPKAIDEPLVAPAVQQKFDELHASLKNLSDAELQKKIREIVDNTVANVQKLTISVSFEMSTYQSITDFLHKVEASKPAIYVSELSYSDSTEDYMDLLNTRYEKELSANAAVLAAGNETVTPSQLFSNTYPSASVAKSQFNNIQATPTPYDGPMRYTGTVTLTYFAISKIHDQAVPSTAE